MFPYSGEQHISQQGTYGLSNIPPENSILL